MNFDSKKNGGTKLFLQSQSTNIVYPNDENVFMVLNNKRKGLKNTCCLILWGLIANGNEIILLICACHFLWMNINTMENG